MDEAILRLRDVTAITRLSRSTIYRLAQHGNFPRPIALTARASGWRRSEIEEWLNSRPRRDRLASVNGGGR
jgi:prophage regulatory protein